MSVKSFIVPIALGVSALALAFILGTTDLGSRPERVEVAELEAIQGLSTWRTIWNIASCSEYNTSIANDPNQPNIPGEPPGVKISVDHCTNTTRDWCVECDSNMTQWTGAENGSGGFLNGKMDPHSVSCGSLYFGKCMPDSNNGFTCNNNGTPNGTCADATEYWNQPIPTDEPPGQTSPTP